MLSIFGGSSTEPSIEPVTIDDYNLFYEDPVSVNLRKDGETITLPGEVAKRLIELNGGHTYHHEYSKHAKAIADIVGQEVGSYVAQQLKSTETGKAFDDMLAQERRHFDARFGGYGAKLDASLAAKDKAFKNSFRTPEARAKAKVEKAQKMQKAKEDAEKDKAKAEEARAKKTKSFLGNLDLLVAEGIRSSHADRSACLYYAQLGRSKEALGSAEEAYQKTLKGTDKVQQARARKEISRLNKKILQDHSERLARLKESELCLHENAQKTLDKAKLEADLRVLKEKIHEAI